MREMYWMVFLIDQFFSWYIAYTVSAYKVDSIQNELPQFSATLDIVIFKTYQ